MQRGSGGRDAYFPWFSFPIQKVSVSESGIKLGHNGAISSVWVTQVLSRVQIVPELQNVLEEYPVHDLKLYGPVQINLSEEEHFPVQCVEQSAVIRLLSFWQDAEIPDEQTVATGQFIIGPVCVVPLHWRIWFSFKQAIFVFVSHVPQLAASDWGIKS